MQWKPLYFVFIYVTKVYDLVSRAGLCNIVRKISSPLRLFSLILSFHENVHSTMQFDGSTSNISEFKSGVYEGL